MIRSIFFTVLFIIWRISRYRKQASIAGCVIFQQTPNIISWCIVRSRSCINKLNLPQNFYIKFDSSVPSVLCREFLCWCPVLDALISLKTAVNRTGFVFSGIPSNQINSLIGTCSFREPSNHFLSGFSPSDAHVEIRHLLCQNLFCVFHLSCCFDCSF